MKYQPRTQINQVNKINPFEKTKFWSSLKVQKQKPISKIKFCCNQNVHYQQNTKAKQNPYADIKFDAIRRIKTLYKKAIIAQNSDCSEEKKYLRKVE